MNDNVVKILTQISKVLTSSDSLFDIKYTKGEFLQDVEKKRVGMTTLVTTAQHNTPTDEMQSSLMLINHWPMTTTATMIATTTMAAAATTTTQYLTPDSYKYLMKSANQQ